MSGLIPALAGKTISITCRLPRCRAHPRAGGENVKLTSLANRHRGSSPRWRGKQKPRRSGGFCEGLIPALAGKTSTRPKSSTRSRAHPRAGGENCLSGSWACGTRGSSPRWRGKLDVDTSRAVPDRLIPALAGKTRLLEHGPPATGAHPRAGGENDDAVCTADVMLGSSPRWRGKHNRRDPQRPGQGLIPALAGKTFVYRVGLAAIGAHPRAGGENTRAESSSRPNRGSSPRWRGKRSPRIRSRTRSRLIPALAGKTPTSPRPLRPSRAHPRAGGENCRTRSAS